MKEMAEYAKSNNAKIVVTGYADSKTGTAEYNKKLSEKRAEAVVTNSLRWALAVTTSSLRLKVALTTSLRSHTTAA